jgi:uncharacterized protein YegJ (DUF2314 family)
MRLIRLAWMLPLLLAPVLGAAQDAPRPTRERDNVYSVPEEDDGMGAAIARARATLPVFHRYLEQVGQGQVHEVKLKAEFHQGDDVEHMWIADVTFDGRVYRGVLESRPLDLTNVRQGAAVTIPPERVSDWVAIVGDGVMLGNFTTMEIRRRMTSRERARLDEMMGYRILADSAIVAVPRQQ